MDNVLRPSFPVFTPNPTLRTPRIIRRFRASVRPPPPGFDFRREILEESKASIASSHPELLDLADDAALVLVRKRQFGPVPAWRSEFVEPEEIWLLGTTHISRRSADDVVRVVRAVRPDNVVVELCRSRQVSTFLLPSSCCAVALNVVMELVQYSYQQFIASVVETHSS